MSRETISAILSKYLPPAAVDICSTWIVQKNIHMKITRERSSKYGDYRPLSHGKGHQITVNHDLNEYAFLITFVHEVAHLETFVKYKYCEPHGKEWKSEFGYLLTDFMLQGIFPDDIKHALSSYIRNPAASSCSDHHLFRTLKRYDAQQPGVVHLEDLPENTTFSLNMSRPGLVFRKGHLIRKRFHCIEIKSNRIYFVSPLAEVKTV